MEEKPKVKILTYETQSSIIDNEIYKRGGRWKCQNLEFEDASQIVRLRIYQQFDKWDQSRPFLNWVNRVITNALINLHRDNVVRYEKPCNHCAANEGGELCRVTKSGKKCGECRLFREWEMGKKHAFNVKVPVSIENHIDEVNSIEGDFFNLDESKLKLDGFLKEELNEKEYKMWRLLFVENKSEVEAAREMGFKTSEKNKKPGYRMILNYRDLIQKKAMEIFKKHDFSS